MQHAGHRAIQILHDNAAPTRDGMKKEQLTAKLPYKVAEELKKI